MKKGFTLVELVVAMAIFLTVITLAVGAFVTISRMKAMTSTMKETQQKTRIAMEMISRLARQAEKVRVTEGGKGLELYFDTKQVEGSTGARFAILDNRLEYSTCSGSLSCTEEGLWQNPRDLYSGINVSPDSSFVKKGSIPPQLDVRLHGEIENASSYYSDEININTSIILEGIR